MEELHFKRTAHPHFSPDIVPSDFFLFGWLKIQLVSRFVGKIDELFEAMEAILDTLIIETITSTFTTGSKD
jgi:hypothetical protein